MLTELTSSSKLYDLYIPEGEARFVVKLQDYTAVEKDEVVLDCELNKDVPVRWFHNEAEIKASKTVTIKAEDKRRILIIKRVGDKDKGQYVCDCETDKTIANLNIEGRHFEPCTDPSLLPIVDLPTRSTPVLTELHTPLFSLSELHRKQPLGSHNKPCILDFF